MLRTASICVLAAALLVVAVPASAPAAVSPGPEAGASRACNLTRSEQEHLGTTYVISLRVSGPRVWCKKTGREIFHKYTQNT